ACAACVGSATGALCVAGACGCQSAGDCPAGGTCDPTTHACARCGGTNVLSDDFPGSDPGEGWAIDASGGGVAAGVGGEMVVTLPNNMASGSSGAFHTNRFYDLRGDAVSVEVASAGSTATTASAFFSVGGANGDYLQIMQQQGTLQFTQQIGGV